MGFPSLGDLVRGRVGVLRFGSLGFLAFRFRLPAGIEAELSDGFRCAHISLHTLGGRIEAILTLSRVGEALQGVAGERQKHTKPLREAGLRQFWGRGGRGKRSTQTYQKTPKTVWILDPSGFPPFLLDPI